MSTPSCQAGLRRGGNSEEGRQLAADDANRMEEGQPIRVLIGFERGFMHETANGEVGHQYPEELLPDQVGCLAAQDDTAATQVGLQFAQGRLDIP